MKIFDYLESLTFKKTDLDFSQDEIYKEYDCYWINRWISMCDLFLPVVAEINKYQIPKETHYNFWKAVTPKRKYFFKYIKKTNDISNDDRFLIGKYYKVGLKQVDEILKILSEEQIQNILNIYKGV